YVRWGSGCAPRVEANQCGAQHGPKRTPWSGRLPEQGMALGRRNHLCKAVLKKQHERVVVEIHIPLLQPEVFQIFSSSLGCGGRALPSPSQTPLVMRGRI